MSISGILLTGMISLFVLALGFIVMFTLYQRRMIAKDLQQQKMENEYQKELLKAAISNQEAERKRIAHDLHDEIGTLLSTSRLYFNQLRPDKSEEQLNVVRDKINSLFDEMMLNIRQISHDLRPVVLENFGLVEAIESIRHKLVEASINFHFTYDIIFKMNSQAELILYRIIQELVSNTLKHANASSIDLLMQQNNDEVFISYKDNGIGFSSSQQNGLGLKSIESRLSLLQSSMRTVATAQGVHFSIHININHLEDYEKS